MAVRDATPRRRLGIGALMGMVAGIAVGFWIVVPSLDADRDKPGLLPLRDPWDESLFFVAIAILGGLSVLGPVILLLAKGRRPRARWGPGELIWFVQGMASWLLWPPVIYGRLRGKTIGDTTSGVCWAYGTPLMAIYMVAGLTAGRWIRRRRRGRRVWSWHERFGLMLGLLWAVSGLYVLYHLYRSDFFGR